MPIPSPAELKCLETARFATDYLRVNGGSVRMSAGGSSDLAQYRVQRRFADHRAFAPRDAIEYAPSGPVERKAFERLRAAGVIRQAAPAHYWFDLDRMGHDRARKRNPKTYVAIALAVVLACLAYMLSRG